MNNAPTNRFTLLLVDDSMPERDLYAMVLRDHFRVVTASRGDDALSLAVSERPAIILLDVMMPGLTGWETCTRIKSNPATAHIPVVLLTAVDDVDLTQHAFAVGADDVVNKPCSAERLLQCVRALLAMHEKEKTPSPRPEAPLVALLGRREQ